MMPEISLHILDIVQNALSANACLIEIFIDADTAKDVLRVAVKDNGRGMDEETAKSVASPFATSRTTRKVGLGIPFFKEGAESCGGSFELRSKPGRGTYIAATYRLSHIDRPPLGNMADTVLGLVACNPDADFVCDYRADENRFTFDTREIRKELGGDVPLHTPEVIAFMRDRLREINGGIGEI